MTQIPNESSETVAAVSEDPLAIAAREREALLREVETLHNELGAARRDLAGAVREAAVLRARIAVVESQRNEALTTAVVAQADLMLKG
jgi:hypothetical protein